VPHFPAMAYELYYWTGIQGRGEYVRLALEEAGARYHDMAREKGDGVVEALTQETQTPSFAPPFLKDGEVIVGQTSAILLYLGDRLGLAPRDERLRLWTHQIQLTIADFVVEGHDVHHPIGMGRYYEEQKPEARRRAVEFRDERVPKFLDWFETILERNPKGPEHLVGARLSYADLSLFQIVEGLDYAFPRLMARIGGDYPKLRALHDAVAGRPNIAAYLGSDRRLAGNESDLFRHYPELDE
jgi:glutathione S-transferase